MRNLIGKVIEIQGEELNKVPASTSSPSNSDRPAVVVFSQTKQFSVQRQKNATFNIVNPRKVIFLSGGGGGDGDQTTRAEKREEELEKSRKSKVGSFFKKKPASSDGSSGGSSGGSSKGFMGIVSAIGKALAPFMGLAGSLLSTMGAILSLEFLRNPMKFLRRIPGVGGAVVKAGASIFKGIMKGGKGLFNFLTKPRMSGKPPTPSKIPKPPQPRGPDGRFIKKAAAQAGDAAGDVASKAKKVGKVAKFLTSTSKLAKFARLGLGTSTFGLSLLAEYLIYESASQADELVDLMQKNNDALNNLPGQDKMKFQRQYEGRSVQDYHSDMSELFRTVLPDALREINLQKVEKKEPTMSETEFIQSQVGDLLKYALPHKNTGLKLLDDESQPTLLKFAQAHEKAAGGADSKEIISAKELQDTLRHERAKKTGGARLQAGFYTGVAQMFGFLPGDTTIEPSNVDTTVPMGRNAFAAPRSQEGNQLPAAPAEPNPTIIFNEGDRAGLEQAALTTRDPNSAELREAAMGTNHERNGSGFYAID